MKTHQKGGPAMKKLKSLLFHPNTGILLYLLFYFLVSLLFLTDFPWVHSDESWLAGLTRNMMEANDFSVTEAFFDARPRYPHAIKILFHALQMVLISLFGYGITAVRMLSLLASVVSLFFFYLTAKKLSGQSLTAFFLTILFSFDIQFIYTSHMARQESLLLLSLTLCLWLFFQGTSPNTLRRGILLGIVTGLSVGLHPNSFLLACMVGCCYLAWYMTHRGESKKPLAAYVGTTGVFALFFVILSYCFDPQFLMHYFANGADEFGIDAAPGDRLSGLFGFFKRLFLRQGGTYYVAELRPQFLLFGFAAALLLCFFLVMRKEAETKETCSRILALLGSAFGIIAGIFFIGRFSQLSIIFLFPAGWLMVSYVLALFEPITERICYAALLLIMCLINISCIRPYLSGETYEHYLTQVASYAAPEDAVIANLNTDFYFENGSLHDYRNLPYVMQADGSLDSYIEENKIEYIFYTAELSYYYEHRPYYNALYGNIMFAEDLLRYCEEKCVFVGSFRNARYAPRILELIDREEFAEVRVYKTNYADCDSGHFPTKH